MNCIVGRSGLRAVAAALVVFAGALLAAAAPSAAASYTLAYTGTVTSTSGIGGGVFQAMGIVAGDAVSGTMTLDPFNTVADSTGGGNSGFSQASTAFDFHITHTGTPGVDLTLSDSGSGEIVTAGSPLGVSGMRFTLLGAVSNLELTFQTDATGGPLTSLAGLPTSPTALIAMFGGTSPKAYGNFILKGFGAVFFDLTFNATAVTPIPAALPLFASALGGLGFLQWRRRKAGAGTLSA